MVLNDRWRLRSSLSYREDCGTKTWITEVLTFLNSNITKFGESNTIKNTVGILYLCPSNHQYFLRLRKSSYLNLRFGDLFSVLCTYKSIIGLILECPVLNFPCLRSLSNYDKEVITHSFPVTTFYVKCKVKCTKCFIENGVVLRKTKQTR